MKQIKWPKAQLLHLSPMCTPWAADMRWDHNVEASEDQSKWEAAVNDWVGILLHNDGRKVT